KSGKSQQVKLIESRILKHDAYLKVAYSKKENVISWEEVKKSEVPVATLEELNSRK
ncbi:YxeA family protein, partial [Lactococcus lactis]|uniref:YxeA family protein n=1 Tax=Lactococcus lactis TaxID=1358 RepID=UPI00223AFF0F